MIRLICGVAILLTGLSAADFKQRPTDTGWLLGPEDELTIQVAEMQQFNTRTFRVDSTGMIHLPVVGDLKAEGLSIETLQNEISEKLKRVLKHPEVTVNVAAYHSQPVSVWGSVNQPGLHQLQGPTRLIEMLSSSGGTRPDAGSTVRITRQIEWGELPLTGARVDPSGQFTTATLNMDDLTRGLHPADNIFLRSHDVITVDKADLVYVMGEVKKAGGYTLASHKNITLLQAIALAEGCTPNALRKSVKILRKDPEKPERIDITVNLQKIIDGKSPDMALRTDDIVLVPNNLARSVAIRSIEAAVQIGTGIIIWR